MEFVRFGVIMSGSDLFLRLRVLTVNNGAPPDMLHQGTGQGPGYGVQSLLRSGDR